MEQSVENLSHVLRIIFEPGFRWARQKNELRPFLTHGMAAVAIRRGECFIRRDDLLDHICILLEGRCGVIVSAPDGTEMVADAMEPVECFGLSEALTGCGTFHASVRATGDCVLLRIAADLLFRCIDCDLRTCRLVAGYLAYLATRNMDSVESQALSDTYGVVARFLYGAAAGKPLPCVIPHTRSEIASLLHLNLRTLYRYLDRFKSLGIVEVRRGKLTVGPAGLRQLEEICRGLL